MGTFDRRRVDQARPIPPTAGPSRFGVAKGQTAVEFAMVALLFFLLIFAVIDYARAFFVQMNVQQAVQDAGRFASTGNHLTNPSTGAPDTRVQSIIQTVENEVVGVPGVNPNNLQISAVSATTGAPTAGAGGPGDIVTLSLTTNLPLMTPLIARLFSGGNYTFISSATFKNEPFDAANTN